MNEPLPVPAVPAVPHGRVLVVDDDPGVRAVCADILELEGYEVTTVRNGREAVEALAHAPADLVLMDIMMPVLDGLAACRAMKANPDTNEIPVVMMSAAGNLQAHRREMGSLAASVIPKPFDFDQLLATVHEFVT